MNIIVVSAPEVSYKLVKATLDKTLVKLDWENINLRFFRYWNESKVLEFWAWKNKVTHEIYRPWDKKQLTEADRIEAFDTAKGFIAFWDMEDRNVQRFIDLAEEREVPKRKVVLF